MPTSDMALVRRWINDSDGEAFAEIVARHSAMVYGTCVRILGDAVEAEDVTQDCFIKLGEGRNLVGASLGGLLHTLATHLSLNRLRAQSRRRRREIAYALDAQERVEVDWDDVQHHVDEAMADLPQRIREPIIAHFLEGQTHRAIAEANGVDESTVRYRIKKGIQEIRTFLNRRGIPVGAALGAMLEARLAESVVVPMSLAAALGKLAIAGSPTVAVGASKLAIIGGSMLMLKKAALAAAALVAVLGASYAVLSMRETPPSRPSPQPSEGAPTASASEADTRPSDAVAAENTRVPTDAVDPLRATAKAPDEGATQVPSEQDRPSEKPGPRTYTSKDIPPDNAFHYFLLAAELMPSIPFQDVDAIWTRIKRDGFPDDAVFQALLGSYQDAFDAIRTGLDVGNAVIPLPAGPSGVPPSLAKFRDLARVMAIEAQYAAARGDYTAAFDEYATLLGFTNESTRGGVLVAGLVGFALKKIAADSLVETLRWGGAEPEGLRLIIDRIQALDREAYRGWEMIEAERQAIASWQAEGTVDGMAVRSEQDLDQDYATYSEYLALPFHQAQQVDVDAIAAADASRQILIPALVNIAVSEARIAARLRGAMVLAAVELYEAQNATYPTALADLVPDCLAALPTDPFTGEPFAYASTESDYLLYSAGPDMQDDGGSPLSPQGRFNERTGDMVFHSGSR